MTDTGPTAEVVTPPSSPQDVASPCYRCSDRLNCRGWEHDTHAACYLETGASG
jgi:hypothetical protein